MERNAEPGDPPTDRGNDVRRTLLAAERTWLAWWRTGLAVSAVALAVGRLLPGIAGGARWPSRLLGLGYALLAVAVFVTGALRQRNTSAAALAHGSRDELPWRLVTAFTVASIILAVGTVVVITAEL